MWLLTERKVREGVLFPRTRTVWEQTPCTVDIVGFSGKYHVVLPSGKKKWVLEEDLVPRRETVYA